MEENNYYPFGLKHSGYNNTNLANTNYKYKYNGKELQEELNLYDYGARNYDPAIGRWFNIDPLAEKSRRFSPYTYALNNPVFFIDPDGMEATDWVRKGNKWSWVDGITSKQQAIDKGYSDYSDGKTNNTFTSVRDSTVTLGENGSWTETSNNNSDSEKTNSNNEGSSSNLDSIVNSDEASAVGITGSVISEASKNLEKVVDARAGVFLTDNKTVIEKGSLRQLNSSTFKGIKTLSKGVSLLGYAMTVTTVINDIDKGNYYTAGTRTAINAGIIGVSAVCAPCGFALSIGEATLGNHIYDYVENNFDKK